MDNHGFINVKIDRQQLEYAKNIQNLLCKRLDTKLPVEYEIPDIIIEQAMFLYIDTMERYYRLEGKEWEDFYKKFSGVTDVPRKLEDFRELNTKPFL
jgi:hypothetical protein